MPNAEEQRLMQETADRVQKWPEWKKGEVSMRELSASLNVTPGLYRMRGGGVAVVKSVGPGGAAGHVPEAKTRTKWNTYGLWGGGEWISRGDAPHPWDLVERIEEPQG